MQFLYNLLITPIELLVEVTYGVMYRLLDNCGLAIIAVSLVIQTLILPLYKRADAIQEEERRRQADMAYWVRHIKKTFKGDERFMMLSTYYRQQNYKSWYPLKSSISILLQIPFFIAAYHYLSNLSVLSGQSFLFIRDLGEADSIVSIGSFPVNILPILMTGFNLISGMIYTRGQKVGEKIQVYGLAAIFLVLLYNSPSGLVLYWTMNNLYSMMKNVCMKLLAGHVHLPRFSFQPFRKLLLTGYAKSGENALNLYLLEAAFLTSFTGGVISINVVSASPAEFIADDYGPAQIVIHNLSIYAGVFLVWGTIFVTLMKPVVRYVASVIIFAVSLIAVVDYMGFGTNLGTMSALLVYDDELSFSKLEIIANAVVIALVLIFSLWMGIRHSGVQKRLLQVIALGAIAMCVINGSSLKAEVEEILSKKDTNSYDDDEKMIHLSKSGDNVIIFMLDRAISGYIPFIFDEKPEIAEAFEGFTYYPNTLSFGPYTNFASPAIFGGYEYTPVAMNARSTESLMDKHDEALCMLPQLFSDEGYQVTVCSPPYAGYMWDPDLSIFDGIENVSAYDVSGKFTDEALQEFAYDFDTEKYQQSNMFYFAFMKICPVVIQPHLYRSGTYWTQDKPSIKTSFIDEYSALTHLINMTDIQNDNSNNVLIMQNSTTHNITLLQTPEYVPAEGISTSDYLNGVIEPQTVSVDNVAMKLIDQKQTAHYQTNVASLEELSKWFTYIKENNCWDNTRIIVVSDHGFNLGQFDYMELSNGIDVEFYNPLLLVKDFGASEYSVSDEFMTNADVPTLAVSGLIENPINPYTGNVISSEAKEESLYVTTSENWETTTNNGNVFDTSDGDWYIVGDNIFDVNNWTKVEEAE